MDPFPERYRRALDDDALRETLLNFQRNWRATRDATIARLPFEDDRRRFAEIKDGVISDLPRWIGEFQRNAEAHGARTYLVESGSEAAQQVIELIRSRGASSVVKSKSMLSEEIDLNEALLHAGIRVVETDLGEWIVQLAGERPSHIVGPALHKNRYQVADLLERATGETVDREDIAAQVASARRFLRTEFLEGTVGISGANALVAESGSVVIVTNEGNAELVTSIPPVHIVLAGIEKLVPTLDDALQMLEILAPSATGQRATSYVSMMCGPNAPNRELYIVLVDNGRSAMARSRNFHEALRCIRCGACSSVCPAYGVVGGHVFGYVYSGAIGLVNTPFHHGLEHDAGPQSLCVSCNACAAVCPADIPLPRQILDTRAEVVASRGLPAIQRLGLEVWSRPAAARTALRAAGLLQRPFERGKYVQPPGLGELTSWRWLPALARTPFRDRISSADSARRPAAVRAEPASQRALGAAVAQYGPLRGMTIAYFVQCLTDWLYPEMGEAIVAVLRGLGATVTFPPAQHCCGLPALDSGDPERARRMARQTIQTLEAAGGDYIVTGGTSCVIAVAHEYRHLFAEQPAWAARAERVARRMFDFARLMLDIAQLPAGALAGARTPAVYHYFCQSYNVLNIRGEPLHLLRDVCGLDITLMPEANVCCGFGGSVSFTRPEMCKHILARKLENLDSCDARLLVTDNPGCIMHLRGGIAASGRDVRVAHTAEIVAERLRSLTPD